MDEAVEEFKVVVDPPAWRPFDVAGVDVERTAEALVDGRMAAHHLLHEQFLFGRAHGHEHEVRPFRRHVVDECTALLERFQVAVAVAYDADVGIFAAELGDSFVNHFLPAADEVERLVAVARRDAFQPELTSRQLARFGVAFLAQGVDGTRPVAEADVAVDDIARFVGGVQDFFGVDRNKDALVRFRKGQQLVERAERVDLDAVERHAVVGCGVFRIHLKCCSYRFIEQR